MGNVTITDKWSTPLKKVQNMAYSLHNLIFHFYIESFMMIARSFLIFPPCNSLGLFKIFINVFPW